jgi:hypothetical protein
LRTFATRPRSSGLSSFIESRWRSRFCPLVPVGVEDGRDQDDELVEVKGGGREEDGAGQHERGLLAFDLPGVDVGLDVNDEAAVSAHPFGPVRQGFPDDDERNVAALRASAEGFDAYVGALLFELGDEVEDVGIA